MVQTCQDAPTVLDNPDTKISLIREASLRRTQAQALLRSLVEAKAECERQLVRFKRMDVIKTLTGRSALDKTIASTRKMIENLDRALASVSCGGECVAAPFTGAESEFRSASKRPA